jgi:hypothetical protein
LSSSLLLLNQTTAFLFPSAPLPTAAAHEAHKPPPEPELSTASQGAPSNDEGMFQPQPTPYSPFAYGVLSFQPSTSTSTSTSTSALKVDPTVFQPPLARPVDENIAALNYNNSNLGPRFEMAANAVSDLEQQEELARNFQPELQVWCSCS